MFGRPYFGNIEPLRIPYMGSKRKIAKDLFTKMLELKPNAKYFFDIFAGGGAMSFYALQLGLKVHYNEKQKGMVDLLNYILERARKGEKGKYGLFPDDFYKFIAREEFEVLKDEDSIKGQFARICYSFGNNQRDYSFGEIEELKHLGHNIVIFRDKEALEEFNEKTGSNFVLSEKKTWSERRFDFMRQFSRERRDKKEQFLEQLERLQQLERLEQLEQLEQLQRIEQLERLPVFTITNLDFQSVKIETPIEETIVYLDPPYRGTAQYKESSLFDDIDNYFKNSSYDCFMSEYNAPFHSVLEIKKESLLNNSNLVNRKFVTEKLFWNKLDNYSK